MKNLLITFLIIALCAIQPLFAQSPQQFNYQAVVRDVSGNPITDTDIGIKLSILQGSASGTTVCTEEFSSTTNSYGLLTIEVGSSNEVDFNAIDWSDGPYFLKVEVDQSGGTSYTEMGSTQLLSVPYALHAATAAKSLGDSLWRQSEDNLYYSEGKIGVGTSAPLASLSVRNEDLPTTAGSRIDWLRLNGNVTNTDNLYVFNRRHEDGSNWNSSEIVMQKQVDATPMHFISFVGSQGNASFLKFGYNNTTHLSLAQNGNFGIGVDKPEASLDVNGSIRTNSSSGTVLYGITNPFGIPDGDGYRIRWDPSWLATNMDALIFEKTDFNSPDPDGAIAFVNTGNDGVENHTLTVRGNGRVGVGTSSPGSKLGVETESGWSDEVPLFEVKNNDGTPVFAVYNNGVRVLVEDDPAKKGPKGGFAIGGFDPTKAGSTVEFMRITPDSIRFNINNSESKGPKGGFAIGGFDRTKGIIDEDFMYITPTSSNSGQYNTFFGYQSGLNNLSGSRNYFSGYRAGYTNRYGDNNIFIGREAGYSHNPPSGTATGDNNIFIGNKSGYSSTAGSDHATDNIFIGNYSGYQTRSNQNVIIGNEAGRYNTGGIQLVFLGNRAGNKSTGSYNVFIGDNSAINNTSGSSNTSVGAVSGTKITTSADNSFFGAFAGYGYGTGSLGSRNVFLGTSSGYAYNGSIGNDNVFIGYRAGYKYNKSGGSGNVFIGSNVGKSATGSNLLFIDNSDDLTPLIYGDFATDRININGEMWVYGDGVENYALVTNGGTHSSRSLFVYKGAYTTGSWQTSSDIRYKDNIMPIEDAIDIIESIDGVRFNFRTEDFTEMGFSDKTQIGVIAQDIEKVLPELVTEDDDGYKAVAYDKLTSVLIQAVKEQQEQIENQHEEINVLNSRINMLEQMVTEMAARQE